MQCEQSLSCLDPVSSLQPGLACNRDFGVLIFVRLQLRAKNQTQTLTPGRNVCVVKDDFRENQNSSNKRCTIVYRQNFSLKLN